jgi:hypothetical protein
VSKAASLRHLWFMLKTLFSLVSSALQTAKIMTFPAFWHCYTYSDSPSVTLMECQTKIQRNKFCAIRKLTTSSMHHLNKTPLDAAFILQILRERQPSPEKSVKYLVHVQLQHLCSSPAEDNEKVKL